MAKVKYGMNLETGLGDFRDETHLDKVKDKMARWVDDVTGASMKLNGKGFEASDDNDDYLSAGTIHSLTVKEGKDELVVSVTDLNVKATQVFKAFDQGGYDGVINLITKRDDVQIGSNDDDLIYGGAGDDVLTGKGGSDLFIFNAPVMVSKSGPEHDIITDFDTKGSNADRIFLDDDVKLKSVHEGDDTLVKLDGGSTLLIEGVKKADFQLYLDTDF